MKKLYLWMLVAAAMMSCTGKKAPEEVKPQAPVDSISADADTVGIDSSEVAPPTTVDELFADFIYTYSTNRSFQYRRTAFPLRRTRDGRPEKDMSRAAWKFDNLYYRHDLHLVILDGEKALNTLATVNSDTVRVEWLLFSKKWCKQYVFARKAGEWNLVCLNSFLISRHRDADFLNFYERFATDSLFQSEHLNETIDFITYDEDNHYEKIEGIIESEQYPMFSPELPADDIFNIDYGVEKKNRNVRVVSVRGNSNGLATMFKFVRKGGEWKLVKFES